MFSRTKALIGQNGVDRLRNAKVLIVGLGGVGGYVAEALCRAGVGSLTLVDGDTVSESNINRQIIALHSTIGRPKAEVFGERLADINPNCQLTVLNEFLRDERMVEVLRGQPYDCVVDAIDSLSPKVYLLAHCHELGIPVVSSMGSAGKLDPAQVKVCDISKTYNCPLAAQVRKRLHRQGIFDCITAVFSPELPFKRADASVTISSGDDENCETDNVLGTISYLPPLFGLHAAASVIQKILDEKGTEEKEDLFDEKS